MRLGGTGSLLRNGIEDGEAHMPVAEVFDGEEEVEENDEPVDALEPGFGAFVAELVLGQVGCGPSSGELKEVQGLLRCSPLFLTRLLLVLFISQVGQKVDGGGRNEEVEQWELV